jgi:cytochrome P450
MKNGMRFFTRTLLGDLPDMRRDALAVLEQTGARGPVARLRLGPQAAVVVSGPEECREVLVNQDGDFDKGRLQRRALRPTLRNGLIISEGELHERQRRAIAPYFTARRTSRYVALMGQVAERNCARLRDGDRVDVLALMGGMTRELIAEMLWTHPLDDEGALADAITRVFEWEMHVLTSIAPAPTWCPTPRNRRLLSDIRFVRSRISAIIEQRRQSPGSEGDLLDALLEARHSDGSGMSDDQLLDEVITLWGAAHETSADAQFWTAYLLSTHPAVAARVAQEADDVLGDRLPTTEDLPALSYSLQVFKEAMRLYPPAASMLREATRDTSIGGEPVRRGTIVFVSPYAMHRRAALYPDPLTFDPDRFTPSAERDRPRYAYMPFGAGPHVCIGGQLALNEGQVFTAVMARRLRLHIEDPDRVRPQLLINVRPRGVVSAEVRRREHASTVLSGASL